MRLTGRVSFPEKTVRFKQRTLPSRAIVEIESYVTKVL